MTAENGPLPVGADVGTLPGPTVTCTGTGRLAVDFVALDSNPALNPIGGETGGDWIEAVPEFTSDVGSNFAASSAVLHDHRLPNWRGVRN